MNPFPHLTRLPALGAALVLSWPSLVTTSAASPYRHPKVVQALRRDLKAIPPNSQPTAAQKQALAADLAGLFRKVDPVPAVTLNYAAEKLAEAAARGIFFDTDFPSIALELTIILGGSTRPPKSQVAALEFSLHRARVDQTTIQQLTDALQALANNFQYDYDSNILTVGLDGIDAEAKGYRHASGYASLNRSQSPVYAGTSVSAGSTVGLTLNVTLSQAPRGKYEVSVTTKSGQTMDLGTLKVGYGGLVSALALDASDAPAVMDDPSNDGDGDGDGDTLDPDSPEIYETAAPGSVIAFPPGSPSRYGSVVFGDTPYSQPLPAGLSLEDVATVTVTVAPGTQRFTGSLVDPSRPTTSRAASLHLVATAAAPTASGSIGLGAQNSDSFRLTTFQLAATGLPANATLTLAVDGVAVESVTTGPTGKLFVKNPSSVFPKPPKRTEIVNILPDTVDVFTVKSFSLSDVQGNVLLSGAFKD